ncbi:MAG TPA: hypothetical protein VL738_36660 [Dactylosporangium sp.]|nr:hypothetical protein [Dactylosporangium sp.]
MRQLQLFTTKELAAMRDRTKSRRYSPAGEEFRREHARQRAWGLARRHDEKLRRLRAAAPPPSTPAPPPQPEPSPPHPSVDAAELGERPASDTGPDRPDSVERDAPQHQAHGGDRPGPVAERRFRRAARRPCRPADVVRRGSVVRRNPRAPEIGIAQFIEYRPHGPPTPILGRPFSAAR